MIETIETILRKKLGELSINDYELIEDMTYAVRTGKNQWSICDNGEEVSGCDLDHAIKIIEENLGMKNTVKAMESKNVANFNAKEKAINWIKFMTGQRMKK